MKHAENVSFEKWKPLNFPEWHHDLKFDIENILVSNGCLDVSLNFSDRNSCFHIKWQYSDVVSYSVCDETYRADCWKFDFDTDGRFFIVKESEYLEMIKTKSPLVPENTIHFLIVGTNTIVDVLAKDYPI